MPNVEHSSLSGVENHEPKDISTASAGDVYVANGSGSGQWTALGTGWGYYKDDAAGQVFNTTAAKLSIDGADSTTETSYLPRSIRSSGALWDTTEDLITPVAVGDAYELRVDLPFTAKSGSPGEVILQLDIGGASSPTVVIVTKTIDVSATAPFTVAVSIPIFCLSTFKTNGGQIFLSTDSGTATVTAPGIFLAKIHSGDN